MKRRQKMEERFRFEGTGGRLFWLLLWRGFITLITLGIYGPWLIAAICRWAIGNTYVNGRKLAFKGSGAALFGNYLLVWFLTIITLGIYYPWGVCRILRWIVNNTYFTE